ncbi:MAG TPA: RNA methyltransferase, partial [Chitinophagales bacterium]|nr:RNA methyltransferase [Chitinophagales bacterium]
MLSKAFEKYVNSLRTKKGRRLHNAYVMEGEKSVKELLSSDMRWQKLIVSESWLRSNPAVIPVNDKRVVVCTEIQMEKVTSLQTAPPLLAVVDIPLYDSLPDFSGFAFVLDGIQDPGNLGTVVRTADWFGVDTVFVSDDTVDAYNPKTVQAAMGSLLRVNVIERNLHDVFAHYTKAHVYAADMNGNDLRTVRVTEPALLIIGNEGSGIRDEWKPYIHTTLTIPKFGDAESLNASVAAAVVCAWWRLNAKIEL